MVFILRVFLTALLAAQLACCGGGSSTAGGVGSGGTGAAVGTVQVAVTDAPSSEFDHVWITVTKIRVHASNSAGPDDAGWHDITLSQPVSLDLATLNNGALSAALASFQLAAGSYQQFRLVLADEKSTIAAGSQAQTLGLSYVDQVDYTDAGNISHSVPLEIANAAEGIKVAGSFDVVAGQTLKLAFDFNLGDDVVKVQRSGAVAYVLKPRLQYFDLDHAGAVSGKLDLGSTGAFGVVVKAERAMEAGALHYVVRSTSLRADGSFTLFPVPLPTLPGGTAVDVLIRGRNMATMIIRNVPVTAGTTTSLTQNAMPATASSEYTATMAAGTLKPSGAWVTFYQTLPGAGELPYVVNFRQGNPFTGTLTDPVNLASADLEYAAFIAGSSSNTGADLSFTSVAPAEGTGSFQAWAGMDDYQSTAATAVVAPPASGSGPVAFSFTALTPLAGLSADNISGSITQSAATYDSGYLVLSRDGLIATTLDLGATLALNGGNGGAYNVGNLAGGSSASPRPGTIYYGYAIVWNSAHPLASLHVQTFGGGANLSQGNATGYNLSLN
jgi:hypothetical protein